jgi:hyperosmotically inducible protein
MMNARSLTLTAAVCLALAGLAGCNRDADKIDSGKAPDTTTPPAPSAPTTPPATTPEPSAPSAAVPPAAPPASGETTTDRSAGQTVDDAAVTAKVKAALLAESGVDGTKINVDTFNGRVTLKGEVPSQAQIDKAAQVARGISGVKEVDNRLTMAPAS